MQITLDLSPWMRGPFSGIGRAAVLSTVAVQKAIQAESAKVTLHFVQRSVTHRMVAELTLDDSSVQKFSVDALLPWERFLGNRGVFHSFEHSMPKLLRSKRIITLHDCWTLRENFWQSKHFQERQRPRLERALKRAHKIVVPSQSTFDELARLRPALSAKAQVITFGPTLGAGNRPKGVLQDQALSLRKQLANAPTSTGDKSVIDTFLDKQEPFVLVVANFENRKNHKAILKVFEKVKGLALVLAGQVGFGGDEVMSEIARLRKEGRPVYVLQNLDDESLRKLYVNCRALFSASFEEGFGLPVLEAMTLGKPLVLSRIPAHVELAGDAALYFEPDLGFEDLKEHWQAVRDDNYLLARLSTSSLKRSELFSWNSCGQKLLKLYRSLE